MFENALVFLRIFFIENLKGHRDGGGERGRGSAVGQSGAAGPGAGQPEPEADAAPAHTSPAAVLVTFGSWIINK